METFLFSDQKVLRCFKAQVPRLEKKWSKSDMPSCLKLGYVKPWDTRLCIYWRRISFITQEMAKTSASSSDFTPWMLMSELL